MQCSTKSMRVQIVWKQKMQTMPNEKKPKKRRKTHNWCCCLRWGRKNCQTMNSRRTRGNMKRTRVYNFNLKGTILFFLFGLFYSYSYSCASQVNPTRLWNLMWARAHQWEPVCVRGQFRLTLVLRVIGAVAPYEWMGCCWAQQAKPATELTNNSATLLINYILMHAY